MVDKFIADLKDSVREVKERPASDKKEGDMIAVYGTSPSSIFFVVAISLTNLHHIATSSASASSLWRTERLGCKF